MAEPTSTAAAAATYAAAASGVTLALLGVDYYSLLWGMVGAFLALGSAGSMGRRRAIVYVVLSTIVGAAIGNAAVAFFQVSSRPLLIIGSLVGGAGAQLLVAAMLKAAIARIEKLGGGQS